MMLATRNQGDIHLPQATGREFVVSLEQAVRTYLENGTVIIPVGMTSVERAVCSAFQRLLDEIQSAATNRLAATKPSIISDTDDITRGPVFHEDPAERDSDMDADNFDSTQSF